MTLSAPQRSRSARPASRRDPVHEMEHGYDRMGRLMQDFFGDGDVAALANAAPTSAWPVPADIEETENEYIVEVDLPNVRKEDVNLELRDNLLVISGEIKERDREGVVRRQSRRVGPFEHIVALPGGVNPEKVEASLDDGVLIVRLAKASGDRSRRIEIKNR
jgi:HSP20 family protein